MTFRLLVVMVEFVVLFVVLYVVHCVVLFVVLFAVLFVVLFVGFVFLLASALFVFVGSFEVLSPCPQSDLPFFYLVFFLLWFLSPSVPP